MLEANPFARCHRAPSRDLPRRPANDWSSPVGFACGNHTNAITIECLQSLLKKNLATDPEPKTYPKKQVSGSANRYGDKNHTDSARRILVPITNMSNVMPSSSPTNVAMPSTRRMNLCKKNLSMQWWSLGQRTV